MGGVQHHLRTRQRPVALPRGRALVLPPELSGEARPKPASRVTIAFLESDRPGAPRAGDAFGDQAQPRSAPPMSPLRSRRGHASWRFLSRRALVQSRRWSRLPLGDRDSAASLLDRRFRASTIPSCVGTDGIDGRRDLDHRAVAWPGGVVISSLPAHALPQLVLSGTDVEVGSRFRNHCASSTRVGGRPAPPALWCCYNPGLSARRGQPPFRRRAGAPPRSSSALLLARRRANAVRRLAPGFLSPQAFPGGNLGGC